MSVFRIFHNISFESTPEHVTAAIAMRASRDQLEEQSPDIDGLCMIKLGWRTIVASRRAMATLLQPYSEGNVP